MLGALVGWALRKWGLAPDLAVRAVELTTKAVMAVEAQAKLAVERLPSDTKLAKALKLLDALGKEHPDVAPYLAKHGKALVERVLRSDVTDTTLTPKK